MKKYYILALLLVVIILSGCSSYDEALGNHQSILNDLMEDVSRIQDNIEGISSRLDNLESNIFNTGMVENSDRDLCVGIQNITVSTEQSKELFECIGNGEGYCTCIEKYASCTLDIYDIPVEYRNDFDPECNNQ